MAAELGVGQSTISRELKRGRTRQMTYDRTYYDRYLADAGARVYPENRKRPQAKDHTKYSERFLNDLRHAIISTKQKPRVHSVDTFVHIYRKAHPDEPAMKFFVNTVARALIGKKDWKDSMEIKQGSVKDYITEQFPPTYITDGNAYSFQEQGMAFEEKLKSLNIPVQSLFLSNVEKEISHEYQFDYTMDEAKESLQQTIDFINKHLSN